MGAMKADSDDQYTPEEVARRRDAVLKIMVNTPPQPRVSNRPAGKNRKPAGAGRARKASGRPRKP